MKTKTVGTVGLTQNSGWDEGLSTMKKGEKAVLYISPDYGYGPRGYPPVYES